MDDFQRSLDIMRQGFAKRDPAPTLAQSRKLRLREIDRALAGKAGYQNAWAIDSLRAERAALLTVMR